MIKSLSKGSKYILLFVLALVFLGTTGCGYAKNVRDDVMDCGTMAVGLVPPVVPGSDQPKAVGPIPPAFGVYLEATDFLHAGAMVKHTGDLEWDRRGLGVMVDHRRKFGFGPLHSVQIKQNPVLANAYKSKGNKLDGWRKHMYEMKGPIFEEKAKVLVHDQYNGILPFMYNGWQDWEGISLELAIPEPFITHSGYYVRAGVNPCQMFDAVLSVFCIDLYADSAYKFFSGKPKYSKETAKAEES